MKWDNLKNYKCPVCASPLHDVETHHACTDEECSFSISKEKFDSIISRRPKAYVEPDRTGWE